MNTPPPPGYKEIHHSHFNPVPDGGTRILSMLLDHIIICIVMGIFVFPLLMISLFKNAAFEVSHQPEVTEVMPFYFAYIIIFVPALYICKDMIRGRSLAKRLIKQQVIDHSTEEVASPMKCMIRNLFIMVWPVEVIMVLINPSRRLGDLVAGTRVVRYSPLAPRVSNFRFSQVFLPFVIVYGFFLLLMLAFGIPLTQQEKKTKLEYNQNSYNEAASRALEKLYTDSASQYVKASVRIYDTIEGSNKKYISIVFSLKEDYIEDDDTFQQLRKILMGILYEKYPDKTISGRVKYLYKGRGSMRSSTHSL